MSDLQIVLTKRAKEVCAVTWGRADEGNKASAKKFAAKNGWMMHVLSPNEQGEVVRPAIAYHVWEEKRVHQQHFEDYLASCEACGIIE